MSEVNRKDVEDLNGEKRNFSILTDEIRPPEENPRFLDAAKVAKRIPGPWLAIVAKARIMARKRR